MKADASAVVGGWARSFSGGSGIEVTIEDDVPHLDSEGKVEARDIFELTFAFRWPDALYKREELIRSVRPNELVDYRSSDDPILRAMADSGLKESFILPNGHFIQRYETNKSFKNLGASESLENRVESYVIHAPVLLALWIQDEGIDQFHVTSEVDGTMRVRHRDGRNAYILSFEGPSEELVLIRVERYGSDGQLTSEVLFRDFASIDGVAYPVARVRAQRRKSETRLKMKDGRVVGIEMFGEVKEVSVDHIVSYAAYDVLPDSTFTPDLQEFTTLDESSGQLFDAEGNQVGQITARRKISRPRQWSTLIGAAGVAVIVFAAGAWWIRRRAA